MAANDLPPGVQEIGRVAAKGGGSWVLGSDGGVFAIGGAQFYGAYTTLQNQDPNRKWKSISVSDNGGYTLHDVNNYTYTFDPPAPPTPQAPAAGVPVPQTTVDPAAAVKAQNSASASATISSALSSYGLDPALGADLLQHFNTDDGQSVDAMMLRLRQSPQYKARFPAMADRTANGLSPITEQQYLDWESGATSLFKQYGLPANFYDTPQDLAQFIKGDVSVAELKSRVVDGYTAALSAPPETRNALQSMYGIDAGHLAAFFLDPNVGQQVIQQKFTASQIGGQADKAGFGSLSASEAEALGAGGMTSQQAQQAFGTLGQETQLTQDMSRQDQLAAAGGDVAATAKIADVASQKKAVFNSGGGFAGGSSGVSGLGNANQ